MVRTTRSRARLLTVAAIATGLLVPVAAPGAVPPDVRAAKRSYVPLKAVGLTVHSASLKSRTLRVKVTASQPLALRFAIVRGTKQLGSAKISVRRGTTSLKLLLNQKSRGQNLRLRVTARTGERRGRQRVAVGLIRLPLTARPVAPAGGPPSPPPVAPQAHANLAPTALDLTNSSVAENAPAGATVGNLAGTDPNPNDTLTFAIVGGATRADADAFTIADGTLRTTRSLDRETQATYTLRIRVSDRLGLSFERTFTITVLDVNEAPGTLAVTSTSVPENQPAGTAVGTLSAPDPDAGDTPTFALVSGAGDADNGDFAIVGDELRMGGPADFETKDAYSVRIRATDAGGLTTERSLTITIVDVNEAPTAVALSAATLTENAAVPQTVGTLSATDPDAGATHTFALVPGSGDADNAVFEIDGTTLRATAAVDFETQSSYSVRVRASDGLGGALEATFTITVGDVNDRPVVTPSPGDAAYTEGDPATPVDAGLTVADQDDTTLTGATIRISGGFESGDVLDFVDQSGISGVYDTATGVLTLTGSASIADYQAALRSIGLRSASDAPPATKTVQFVVDDGTDQSAAAQRTVSITPVNDAPALDTTDTALDYPEGAGATAVDPGLTVADVDSIALQGAVVQVTGNFLAAEDELTFADQLGITGTYDDTTGTLTLSGTAPLSDYQTALRSVRYANTSDNPSSATRAITFRGVDAQGATSPGAVREIAVSPVNDAPVVATSGGPAVYGEGDPAVQLDGALTVADADDTSLTGAQVWVSSQFQPGDVLVFVNTPSISGTYNTGTGVLTLTGTASLADYQAALRSISFSTAHDNPRDKTVSFTVDDGDAQSPPAGKVISITAVNDAPEVTTSMAPLPYPEGAGPVAADAGLTLTDADSDFVDGATIQISGDFSAAQDELAFADQLGISGSYDDATGTLTLTGTATPAAYQAALRTVTYENVSDSPSPPTRTVTFRATDADGATSSGATRAITLSAANDSATVTTSGGSVAYTEGDPSVTVDSGLTVADTDDTSLEGARVRISSGFQTGDQLLFVNTASISGTYNTGTGVLTLTGTASLAQYQAALRSIQFDSTSNAPVAVKTVEYRADDGDGLGPASTRTIDVTPVNDGPQVTSGGTLSYTENDPPTAVDSSLTVSEAENDALTGASASITANYQAGLDALSWTDNDATDNITLDGAASSAQTLVLTGSDTAANYQAALRAMTYANSSETPATASRTVTFSATDTLGATGAATRTVAVTSVDDAPVAVNDGATVLEDAGPSAVDVLDNDTDVDGGPKTIAAASDPVNGTVVLTGGSPGAHTGLTYQPDPNFCNDPPGTTSDTFIYTVNGGSTATVSMTVTCVNDAPVADDETFGGNDAAHGNTAMVVDDPSDGAPAPAHPKTTVTGDILAGDSDVDGPGPLTVTPGTFTTNDNGSVTIEADGDFTFHPAPGASCTDTTDFFDYTVEDSGSPERTDTGRVTISIAGCVWYVSNNAAGNSGTSAAPFDTLAQAETASGADHTVFVFDGDNTSTGYGGDGYQMNAGERLIGEHEGLTVDPDGGGALTADALHPANALAHPTLTATNSDVLALDDRNEVRGFVLDPHGTGGAIAGESGDTGGGTIDDVSILDTGTPGQQPALDLVSTTGTFDVSNLVVDTTTATAPPSSATGVRLSNAGTVAFSAASTIQISTSGAKALDVAATSLGTSTFDALASSGSPDGGVRLANATGTIALGDGSGTDLALSTSGSSAALFVSGGDGITVDGAGDDNVSASGGPAIVVSGTASAPQLHFDSVTSSGSTGDGIDLAGLGTGAFSATGGTIGGAAGIAFDLDGGSGAVTYPGAINDGAGATADITGRSGGVVSLSGAIADGADPGGGITLSGNTGGSTVLSGSTKTLNTGAGNALVMSSSDGHTLQLTGGGLDIDTTTGKGLEATTSGTLAVVGAGNTIDTITGTPLRITDTDIAATDATFQRISSNGAANGIVLSSTGTAGGLKVTGNGGACSSPAGCTGGAIQNSTGAGIALTSTSEVSLTRMSVNNGGDDGIRATDVRSGLVLDTVRVAANGNDVFERGLDATNVTGSSAISSSVITGSAETNARLSHEAPGTHNLTVANSTFSSNSSSLGAHGIELRATSTPTVNASITGSALSANRDNAFLLTTDGGSPELNVRFNANTVAGGNPSMLSGQPGIVVAPGHGARTKVEVDGNTVSGTIGRAIIVNPLPSSTATAAFDATVTDNTIGNGTAFSGSAQGEGMMLRAGGNGDARFRVQGNLVRNYAQIGMWLRAGEGTGGTGNADFTVVGNTVQSPSASGFEGIFVSSGAASGDNQIMCADIGGAAASLENAFSGTGTGGLPDIAFSRRFSTQLKLPGFTTGTHSGLVAYIQGRNVGSPTVDSYDVLPTNHEAASCAQPTLPPAMP